MYFVYVNIIYKNEYNAAIWRNEETLGIYIKVTKEIDAKGCIIYLYIYTHIYF